MHWWQNSVSALLLTWIFNVFLKETEDSVYNNIKLLYMISPLASLLESEGKSSFDTGKLTGAYSGQN